ncbi:hypothetical protein PR048_024267 [Dryococelus australis]|uniref:Uncharacterized protein n=1 Tax=Dryococelus australis TaxID=614101 RepID=A0ABQ9GN39_9NEOP|nr:hypothetical protein PR048_024267 [Dryococelus australis]
MEQSKNSRAGEKGDPREPPPPLQISGIVRHDSHMRKSGSDPAGGLSPVRLGGTRADPKVSAAEDSKCVCKAGFTANPSRPAVRHPSVNHVTNSQSEVAINSIHPSKPWKSLTFNGRTAMNFRRTHEVCLQIARLGDGRTDGRTDGRDGLLSVSARHKEAVMVLLSQRRLRFAPGFSHVGILPGDAAGRRVISAISRFPRPSIPSLLHSHFASPLSALKTAMLRASQIPSLLPLTVPSGATQACSVIFVKGWNRALRLIGCCTGKMFASGAWRSPYKQVSHLCTLKFSVSPYKQVSHLCTLKFSVSPYKQVSHLCTLKFSVSPYKQVSHLCTLKFSVSPYKQVSHLCTLKFSVSPYKQVSHLCTLKFSVSPYKQVSHLCTLKFSVSPYKQVSHLCTLKFSVSLYRVSVAMGASGGNPPCMLHASNMRRSTLLWARQTSSTCYDVSKFCMMMLYADAGLISKLNDRLTEKLRRIILNSQIIGRTRKKRYPSDNYKPEERNRLFCRYGNGQAEEKTDSINNEVKNSTVMRRKNCPKQHCNEEKKLTKTEPFVKSWTTDIKMAGPGIEPLSSGARVQWLITASPSLRKEKWRRGGGGGEVDKGKGMGRLSDVGRGKLEIPEKTRRPTASYGTIATCESPVTRPGIEPGSLWWEASVLIAQPPRSLEGGREGGGVGGWFPWPTGAADDPCYHNLALSKQLSVTEIKLLALSRSAGAVMYRYSHPAKRHRENDPTSYTHSKPMRVKRGEYGAAPECKGGGGGIPEKAHRQHHRSARLPRAKTRERPHRELNLVHLAQMAANEAKNTSPTNKRITLPQDNASGKDSGLTREVFARFYGGGRGAIGRLRPDSSVEHEN